MELLDKILLFINSNLEASVFIVGGVVDFALRLIKSPKPLSIMHGLVGILKMGAAMGLKVIAILEALAKYLDKVLPQKVSEPAPVEPPKQ